MTGKISDDPAHIFDFYEISNVDFVDLKGKQLWETHKELHKMIPFKEGLLLDELPKMKDDRSPEELEKKQQEKESFK